MRSAVLLGFILLTGAAAQARDVAGIDVPESVRLHGDPTELTLNGAGIRRRFFATIYIGALYLPRAAQDAAEVFGMAGAKRFSMHVTHAEMPPEKLVPVWNRGFQDNLAPDAFRALRPRIANFNGLFPTLRRGDRVDIDMIPGRGTQVWINGVLRGRVAGDDFARALLGIWLGEHPADAGLKRDLLAGAVR